MIFPGSHSLLCAGWRPGWTYLSWHYGGVALPLQLSGGRLDLFHQCFSSPFLSCMHLPPSHLSHHHVITSVSSPVASLPSFSASSYLPVLSVLSVSHMRTCSLLIPTCFCPWGRLIRSWLDFPAAALLPVCGSICTLGHEIWYALSHLFSWVKILYYFSANVPELSPLMNYPVVIKSMLLQPNKAKGTKKRRRKNDFKITWYWILLKSIDIVVMWKIRTLLDFLILISPCC